MKTLIAFGLIFLAAVVGASAWLIVKKTDQAEQKFQDSVHEASASTSNINDLAGKLSRLASTVGIQ